MPRLGPVVPNLLTTRRWNREGRGGLTLLEVLISLFVLMIALLGLISVLPLADRAMEEAVRADRVQACGQAALQELMMRELLSGVDGQRHPLLSPYVWWNIYLRPVLPQANPLLDVSQGYAIDPWLIAQTADRYLDGQNNWIDPGAQRLEVFPWVPVSQNPPGPDWYWPQLTLQARHHRCARRL